jgi:VWFA-related protein
MRTVALAVLSVAFAAVAAAQQPLTEKIDVNLVNVDVTVTSHGAPARGLTAADFEVREDGALQTITNFFAVENVPSAPKGAEVVGSQPPAQTVDGPSRRHVLVVVDYVHTSTTDRNRVLEGLEHFIDDHSTREYDWAIATAGMDMRMILPLTADKSRIHAAVEAMRHGARWRASAGAPSINEIRLPIASGEAGGDSTFTYYSFRAVVDAIHAFGASEGKKIVLLLSDGFGQAIDKPDIAAIMAPGPQRKLMTYRDRIIHEANASNLNLYIIGPAGLSMGGTSALYWMGRETGGSFLSGNLPEESLRKFEDLTSNFYSLAYRPTHPEDFKYHRINVRLKRSGSYALRYRDGYGALPVEVQLARTLATPGAATMQASSIPLTFRTTEPRKATGGEMVLPVIITVPLKNLQFVPTRSGGEARVSFFISIFDEEGKTLGVQTFETRLHSAHGESTDHGELTHTALIRLTPGTVHTAVAAIHDQITDAVGVVKQRISF